MHFLSFSLLALGLGSALASPTPRSGLVRHEKRTTSALVKKSRAEPDMKVPVRIALAQQNVHLGPDMLLDISSPSSANYGKHMTSKEVGDLFRPSTETVDAVSAWLHESGIDTERHTVSPGKGYLKFEASVEELESLLATQYHIYEHAATQDSHVGCDEYNLPAEIVPHIEFVTPSVSTLRVVEREAGIEKRSQLVSKSPGALKPIVRPANINPAADITLSCAQAATPDCFRKLYGIPKGTTATPGNEIGIFEDGDFYDTADLDATFKLISPNIPNGTYPILHGIDGGTAPVPGMIGVESLLDMSIIFPLIYPQKAILYQVDDLLEAYVSGGFGDTFLDALDASFCTYDGGDDPSVDPHYPDGPDQAPGYPPATWNKTEMCGAYTPTNVISVSYGLGEDTYGYHYFNRQCQECLKLGLQGVTVVYSSGDAGVGNRQACIVPDGDDPYGPGSFSPSAPASCPWLTAVGATMYGPDGKTEVAVAQPDEEYWSGGGFSNYWPMPNYQADTLANYFTNTPPPYNNLTEYGTPYYNRTGRGYPDVSALGLNVLLYAEGALQFVGGTSASAPIFSSIINLINEERLVAGKGRVGFLNPTLYANPKAFTDITSGSNPGCGTQGFEAVKGWDPVTGLGTPKFRDLLNVFMKMP